MKLSQIDSKDKKTVLVYGKSGAGKTIFGTSFPTPIFVADFDGKISSAASYWQDSKRLGEIEVGRFTVDNGSKEPDATRPFRRFVKLFNELGGISAEKFPYKTFMLDSITTFATALMDECMLQNADSARSKMGAVTVPNLKDYGISINAFKNIISQVLTLPCNVVVTGHISTEKDELTGEILNQPLIFGKELPNWLPIVFEEVYHVYCDRKDGKGIYLAQTQQDRKYVARSQIRGLPNLIPLDYSELVKQR